MENQRDFRIYYYEYGTLKKFMKYHKHTTLESAKSYIAYLLENKECKNLQYVIIEHFGEYNSRILEFTRI